jgi:L-lactate permease
MFHQLLTPIGNNLALSSLVALLPIATVLMLLEVWRRPAWQAASAGLIVGLGIAVKLRAMPLRLGNRALAGWRSVRSLWPVLLIAGLSFGLAQCGASNYLNYTLTGVFAALVSLLSTESPCVGRLREASQVQSDNLKYI